MRENRVVRPGRGERASLARIKPDGIWEFNDCINVGPYSVYGEGETVIFCRSVIRPRSWVMRILCGPDLSLEVLSEGRLGCPGDFCVWLDRRRTFMVNSLYEIGERELSEMADRRLPRRFGSATRAIDVGGSTIYYSGAYPDQLVRQAERITKTTATSPYDPVRGGGQK